MYEGLKQLSLDHVNSVHIGKLPESILPDSELFEHLWDLHPQEFHEVKMWHRTVKTPRWQQAYNKTYSYTGSRNNALPVPNLLKPYWDWSMATIDPAINGLLLNWYDGSLGHYIGKHRDSTEGMVQGLPIITISLGQERIFRLRPYQGKGFMDVPVGHGAVLVIPYSTNQAFTHEVPTSAKYTDRRISITLRAFH